MASELETLYKELERSEEMPERSVSSLSEKLKKEAERSLEEYYNGAFSEEEFLTALLTEDDELTEELLDQMALLNVMEYAGKWEIPRQELENAHLTVIDTLIRLSKIVNPVCGFGKDRLLAALDLIRQFEENYWAVSTLVTKNNLSAFESLLPEEQADDIAAGRKKAIGALRQIGSDSCAAGIIVYSEEKTEEEETKLLRIHWIYVHESMREKGVGNFLMALALSNILRYENPMAFVDLLFEDQEEEEALDREVLENFLDSFQFTFTMETGQRFSLWLSELESELYEEIPGRTVVSLESLGKNPESALSDFFRRRNSTEDQALSAVPPAFFDPKTSAVVLHEGRIRAVLFIHRLQSGDFRYEGLRWLEDTPASEVNLLLRFSLDACKARADSKTLLYGAFDSETGFELIRKLAPNAVSPLTFSGCLEPSESVLSNEDWEELRREAGLSNNKFLDAEDADPEKELSEEELDKARAFLTALTNQESAN